jgi:hypothetical protein
LAWWLAIASKGRLENVAFKNNRGQTTVSAITCNPANSPVLPHPEKQIPDYFVGEFVYAWGNDYAGFQVGWVFVSLPLSCWACRMGMIEARKGD